jgi:hypothetical protein
MRRIDLTKGYKALVDDIDYERVKTAGPWYATVQEHRVYAEHKDHGHKVLRLHRFILGIRSFRVKVDHEDGNGLNCQRYNLRRATNTQNAHNARVHKDNTSGYKGVSFNRDNKNWRARIRVLGKQKELGSFSSAKKAALAYDAAARIHFGVFAKTNFKEEK